MTTSVLITSITKDRDTNLTITQHDVGRISVAVYLAGECGYIHQYDNGEVISDVVQDQVKIMAEKWKKENIKSVKDSIKWLSIELQKSTQYKLL